MGRSASLQPGACLPWQRRSRRPRARPGRSPSPPAGSSRASGHLHVCSEHMASASPCVAGLPAQGGRRASRWAARLCLTQHRQRGRLAAPRAADMAGPCRLCNLLAGTAATARSASPSPPVAGRREHLWRLLAGVHKRQGVSRKPSVFLGSSFAVGLRLDHGMRLR